MNDTVLSIIGINVKLSPTVVYPHQNSYCACSGLICLLKEMTNYFPRTCIHLQQCDCHYLSCMYTSWLLRLPWSITANSVYCRHHSNSKVLNWYVWLLWFGLKCSFFLPPTPHPLLSSSSLPPGKPKSSIKKTTRDVPAFFGCLTNRIAQEQHFTKKQYHVYALTKNNNNNSSNISNKYINRISFRYIRSAPDFLSFHSWIHLYYVHTLLSATRSTC